MQAHFKLIIFKCNRKVPSVFPGKLHELAGNAQKEKVSTKKILPGFIIFFSNVVQVCVLRTGMSLVNCTCVNMGR